MVHSGLTELKRILLIGLILFGFKMQHLIAPIT